METHIFKNRRGQKLTGVLERPVTGNNEHYVVCVHGFTGDKDEKGLFADSAKFFCERGLSVFRFDMTGCGHSEGDFREVGIEDQKQDLLSAIQYLKRVENISNETIYILGFSLGASVSLLAYEHLKGIRGITFWSPALFPQRDMYPRYQTEKIMNELATKGYFDKAKVKVGNKIIDDLGSVNLVPALCSIKSPVFMIHGEKDEKISPSSTKIGFELLNGHKWDFKIIPGADHSFRRPKNARDLVMQETYKFFTSI